MSKDQKVSGWGHLKEKYTTMEAVEQKIRESEAKGCSKMYLKILGYLKNHVAKTTATTKLEESKQEATKEPVKESENIA